MSRTLPILFNGDMVLGILDDRKTVTRRVIKGGVEYILSSPYHKDHPEVSDRALLKKLCRAPYQIGDILYVRETWAFMSCVGCNGDYARPGSGMACYDTQAVEYDDGDSISDGCFIYRADCKTPERINWRPSIHMPKQAARIWLKVTDVRVERLQDMKPKDLRKEIGKPYILPEERESQFNKFGAIYFYQKTRKEFSKLWNSTIKKSDLERYGWEANPWVWVIEFERCEKPKSEER